MESPEVTVVVATTASRERSSTLFRAINSLRRQVTPCNILVVANGSQRDVEIVRALREAGDIRVLERSEGNFPKALEAGTRAVETTYFCFLDDDDVLTPDAIRRRVAFLDAHPEADAVVTPGEKVFPDGRIERVPMQFDEANPLASLLKCNWLASCGGMYRRSRVGPDYFETMPNYLEWTYLALRLIRERQVGFLLDESEPHFTIFDTAASESKKLAYVLALPENVARLRDPDLPREVQRLLSDKIVRAAHSASSSCLAYGMTRDAWRYHFASLGRLSGLRYLSYSRHLLRASLGQVRGKVSAQGLSPRVGKSGVNLAGRP